MSQNLRSPLCIEQNNSICAVAGLYLALEPAQQGPAQRRMFQENLRTLPTHGDASWLWPAKTVTDSTITTRKHRETAPNTPAPPPQQTPCLLLRRSTAFLATQKRNPRLHIGPEAVPWLRTREFHPPKPSPPPFHRVPLGVSQKSDKVWSLPSLPESRGGGWRGRLCVFPGKEQAGGLPSTLPDRLQGG